MKQKQKRNQVKYKEKARRGKHILMGLVILALLLVLGIGFFAIRSFFYEAGETESGSTPDTADIPEYSGEPYVEIRNNRPSFSKKELKKETFEHYSELDKLGRCGTAFAKVGPEPLPNEERGPIGEVHPSGWQIANYHELIDGK